MTRPISRERVVPIATPLPDCWLRRAPTRPDDDGGFVDIARVGPGGALHRALIDTIGSASETVLAASFLLADDGVADALLAAAGRGRRVYVITASDETLTKVVRHDESFDAKMIEEHKRLLDRLAGKVLLRSAEHFHAKMLVVDHNSSPRGWITTANFNKALRESVELGVRLDAPAARDAGRWFAYEFWAEAERELAGKGRLAQVNEAPAVPAVPSNGVVLATTKSHASLRAEVSRLVNGATRKLVVASYGLDAGHPLVREIAAKARSGVPVTLLTRPRPAVREAVALLADAGVQVVAHDKLHAKAIVSDAGALVMTANLEANGLDTGFELGVALDGARRDELTRTLDAWGAGFPWTFAARVRRDAHLGEICLADKGLRDGVRTVEREKAVTLPPISAPDALRLEETPDPTLRIPDGSEYVQAVRFKWEVRPPRLPQGAKERLQESEREETGKDGKKTVVKRRVPHEPPIFDHGGRSYVVLRGDGDPARARSAAEQIGATVVLP